jgi:hypothetical protein
MSLILCHFTGTLPLCRLFRGLTSLKQSEHVGPLLTKLGTDVPAEIQREWGLTDRAIRHSRETSQKAKTTETSPPPQETNKKARGPGDELKQNDKLNYKRRSNFVAGAYKSLFYFNRVFIGRQNHLYYLSLLSLLFVFALSIGASTATKTTHSIQQKH